MSTLAVDQSSRHQERGLSSLMFLFSVANLDVLGRTLSSFSLVCSISLVACYVLFKNLRSFAFRMVCMISLADIFFCIGHLLGDQPTGSAGCHFQGLMITYFELVSLFWTVMIARVLQQVFLEGAVDVESNERKYQNICWGVPLLITLLPETSQSFGDAGPYCWIKQDTPVDVMWRFLVFYCWLWVGIGYVVYVYWSIQKQFTQMSELDPQSDQAVQFQQRQKMINRMKFYPATLIFCYFFASINRIYLIFAPNAPVYTLYVLQILFSSLKGCANSVIYGFTGNAGDTVRSAFVRQFQRCGLCAGWSTESGENETDEAPGDRAEEVTAPGQNDKVDLLRA